jgi:hypothetical protein
MFRRSIPPPNKRITLITATFLNLCTPSDPFKMHSLPWGAASFKSLYLKRPLGIGPSLSVEQALQIQP